MLLSKQNEGLAEAGNLINGRLQKNYSHGDLQYGLGVGRLVRNQLENQDNKTNLEEISNKERIQGVIFPVLNTIHLPILEMPQSKYDEAGDITLKLTDRTKNT